MISEATIQIFGAWWADFTAFLLLGVMTVKMGALEVACDVFVLFHAGSGSPPTCINELMRRLKLAFKSPLALRPWCPPLHPPDFLALKSTLYTHRQHHRRRQMLSRLHQQQETRGLTLLQRATDDEMRKNVHLCLFAFFYVCLKEGERVCD